MADLLREPIAVSMVLLLTGCALLLHTFSLGFADLGGAFSPVFFPRIILAGWIALAALSLINDVMAAPSPHPTRWVPVLIIGAAMFAYIELLPLLGFFLCSALFSVVVLLASGQRRALDIVLFSIAIPGALVGLFNHVLTMPLPVSPFFWWI